MNAARREEVKTSRQTKWSKMTGHLLLIFLASGLIVIVDFALGDKTWQSISIPARSLLARKSRTARLSGDG